ncbi:MAG: hypothetical protein KDA85_17005, partial [Planctomycetaceae bacterium]|nr:hypothetical protein [Planctomycetaceae bacterium]
MATVAQLRSQSKKLIQEGIKASSSRTSGKKAVTVRTVDRRTGATERQQATLTVTDLDTYRTIYEDARDLLLEHGYERELAPRIQALYRELIPDSPEFTRHQKSTLKQLASEKPTERLAAAKFVEKETRAEVNQNRSLWLRHPVTVEVLIDTLGNETDARIAGELISALAWIHSRYFADLRIFSALLPLLQAEESSILERTAFAMAEFSQREKWPALLSLLANNPKAGLLAAICRNVSEETPVAWKRKLQPVLIQLC